MGDSNVEAQEHMYIEKPKSRVSGDQSSAQNRSNCTCICICIYIYIFIYIFNFNSKSVINRIELCYLIHMFSNSYMSLRGGFVGRLSSQTCHRINVGERLHVAFEGCFVS